MSDHPVYLWQHPKHHYDDVYGDVVGSPVCEPRRHEDPDLALYGVGGAGAWGEVDLGLFPAPRQDGGDLDFDEDAEFHIANFVEGAWISLLIMAAIVVVILGWIGETLGKWDWIRRLRGELKMLVAMVWRVAGCVGGFFVLGIAMIYLMGHSSEDDRF